MATEDMPRIAMVGFGEAARAFVTGWGTAVAGRIAACDIKAADAETAPAMAAAAAAHDLACHAEPGPALAGAGLIFCLVTADQAVSAASAAAPHLSSGALWLDGNSCAPGTKRRAARVIEAAGGRYVDLAIMAPVLPRRHRTPALLAGPHAKAACTALAALGMDVKPVGGMVGDASAVKMLRSVMIKGVEALTAECLLAARRAGVEQAVLASLQGSNPGIDWQLRSAYNLDRMLAHGLRRAAEMREVVLTLREFGLPDDMARATTDWQQRLGELALADTPDVLAGRLDAILSRLP
jgi:3-hydroxyisobutyrate dehydrogenase-like beta-hydroxyacid dehydrogenase